MATPRNWGKRKRLKVAGCAWNLPVESVTLCLSSPLGPRQAQECGLHLSVGLNFERRREASLWKPVAGWKEELVKQEATQDGITPKEPHLRKPVPSVQAHLTLVFSRSFSARGLTDVVSDEPLCWSGKSTIAHQAQRQEIKVLVTLASQLAFQPWVGLTSQLRGLLPLN